MSVLEWKKFNFFRLIPDAANKKIKNSLKTEITTCISNSVYKIFCDALGCVHIFFRSWDSISFFANSSAIQLCSLSNDNNSLFTLSNADCRNGFVIKVWDLNNVTKRNGAPCIGTAVIRSEAVATAMNATYHGSFFFIAVGFDTGDLSLFRGGLNREFSSGFRSFHASTRRITGIEFQLKNSKLLNMFICSDSGIFCYLITENNDVKETKIILDAKTEPTRCCALQTCDTIDTYFLVGRDDAVYCYTSDGRGPCYAIEGNKKFIAWFADYLIIAIHLTNSSFVSKRRFLLVIIDISHKMIVLNKTMDSISGIFVENKTCYILTDTNEVFMICEKDINTKLQLLMEKHLYDIALRLIEHENYNENTLSQIYKLYGDHLYLKCEYSGAIEKYIKTIGVIEPYCIIRKFLDSKLVNNLSEYLKALLKTDFATEEHIQLLINCNSRLNLPSKLGKFLCELDNEENSVKEVYCNISETMASKPILQEKSNNFQNQIFDTSLTKYLGIINNVKEVEKFLYPLTEHQIYSFFKEHGTTLMKYYPRQTTEIFKSICGFNSSLYEKNINISCPESFIPIFIEQQGCCIDFLEYIVNEVPECNEVVYNYLFELYLRKWKRDDVDCKKLIQFLELYRKNYNEHHVLILCKIYFFWDGVLFFYKIHRLNYLSTRYYMQRNDFKYIKLFYQSSSNFNSKLWIPTINDIDLASEGSASLVNYVLEETLRKRMQSSLQILQSISKIKNFMVSHVKEFYSQEHLKNTNALKFESKIVSSLNNDIQQLKELLRNYTMRPIEFRSRMCYICKNQLKYPAVYFLCQHTFHKHCSEIKQDCVVCEVKKDKLEESSFGHVEYFQNCLTNISQSTDFMEYIAKYLKSGLLNNNCPNTTTFHEFGKRHNQNSKPNIDPIIIRGKPGTNPFENDNEDKTTINPFDEYDANLNPFEK